MQFSKFSCEVVVVVVAAVAVMVMIMMVDISSGKGGKISLRKLSKDKFKNSLLQWINCWNQCAASQGVYL